MKRFISILCIFGMLFTLQSTFAFAESAHITKEDLGNGYYTITVIDDISSSVCLLASDSTVTKSKTTYFKNSNNETLWYVRVTGTFTYNGTTSKCTASTPSAKSYDSAWKISDVSGSKTGNTAKASAVGTLYQLGAVIQTVPKTVTLTCSPAGKFS